MTESEKLKALIQQAIDSGWLPYFASFDTNMTKDNILIRYPEGTSSVNFDYEMKGHIVGVGGYNLEPYSIIFNHDFAKALWGEGPADKDYKPTYAYNEQLGRYNSYAELQEPDNQQAWQYHLQQMVIADDPIGYMYNAVFGGEQ